jgi:hypothetical protein
MSITCISNSHINIFNKAPLKELEKDDISVTTKTRGNVEFKEQKALLSDSTALFFNKFKELETIKPNKLIPLNLAETIKDNSIIFSSEISNLIEDSSSFLEEPITSSSSGCAAPKPIKPIGTNEISINDTPRLSWLIGRNAELLEFYTVRMPVSIKKLEQFQSIVLKYQNSKIIDAKDYDFIKTHASYFKGGYEYQISHKEKSKDPIVHRVIDYISPKTLKRMEMLSSYLATKIRGEDNSINSTNAILDSSKIETSSLPVLENKYSEFDISEYLAFLYKDLEWYNWYLNEDELLDYNIKHNFNIKDRILNTIVTS